VYELLTPGISLVFPFPRSCHSVGKPIASALTLAFSRGHPRVSARVASWLKGSEPGRLTLAPGSSIALSEAQAQDSHRAAVAKAPPGIPSWRRLSTRLEPRRCPAGAAFLLGDCPRVDMPKAGEERGDEGEKPFGLAVVPHAGETLPGAAFNVENGHQNPQVCAGPKLVC
jgi:hypothetical protein